MTRKRPHKKARGSAAGNVCIDCDAPCCRGITMLITKPRTRSEKHELTQYLHFDTARVFIRNNRWHLIFDGKCIYLSEKNMCRKYTKRPARCRRHNPPSCEKFDRWYDVMLSTPEELENYLKSMSINS